MSAPAVCQTLPAPQAETHLAVLGELKPHVEPAADGLDAVLGDLFAVFVDVGHRQVILGRHAVEVRRMALAAPPKW